MRIALAVFWVASAAACGSPRPIVRPSAHEPGAPASAPRALPAAVWLPRLWPAEQVATGPEGEELWVLGSLRASIDRTGRATIATDYFAGPIRDAVRVADGWVFRDSLGVVARSDEFTGPLARLGYARPESEHPRSDRSERVTVVGEGRWTGLDEDTGRWWTSTGAALQPIGPENALSVAFVDAEHGLALIDGGFVVRTSDGGSSWEHVALERPVVRPLVLHAGRVWVDADGPVRSFGRDGAPRDESQWLSRAVAPSEPVARFAEVVYRSFPELASPQSQTPDGHAIWSPAGLSIPPLLVRPRAARVLGEAPLTGWSASGPSSFFSCLDHAGAPGPTECYRWRLGQPIARLEHVPGFPTTDALGEWVAWSGDHGVSIVSEAGEVEHVEEPAGTTVGPIRLLSDALVLALAEPPEETTHHDEIGVPWLLERSTGRWRPLCLEPRVPLSFADRVRGQVVGAVSTAEPERRAGAGDAAGCVRMQPLPEGARAVCFRSSTEWVAIGRSPGELHSTRDGGESWTPFAMSADGALDALWTSDIAEQGPYSCRVLQLAVRWDAGDERADAPRLIVPAVWPPGTSVNEPAPPFATCEAGAPRAIDSSAPGASEDRVRFVVSRRGGATIARASWPPPSDRGRWRASAPVRVEMVDEGDRPCREATPRFVVSEVTAGGALAHCEPRDEEDECDCARLWYWFPRSGRPVALDVDSWIDVAMPLEDGGLGLLFGEREAVHDAIELAPDGAVRAHRRFIWNRARHVGLTLVEGRLHLAAVAFRGDAMRLFDLRERGIDSRSMPTQAGRELPPCAPGAVGLRVIAAPSAAWVPGIWYQSPGPGVERFQRGHEVVGDHGVLRVSPEGTCVEALRATLPSFSTLHLAVTGSSELSGELVRDRDVVPVRCRVDRPARAAAE